jgi:hypothetical protein
VSGVGDVNRDVIRARGVDKVVLEAVADKEVTKSPRVCVMTIAEAIGGLHTHAHSRE